MKSELFCAVSHSRHESQVATKFPIREIVLICFFFSVVLDQKQLGNKENIYLAYLFPIIIHWRKANE